MLSKLSHFLQNIAKYSAFHSCLPSPHRIVETLGPNSSAANLRNARKGFKSVWLYLSFLKNSKSGLENQLWVICISFYNINLSQIIQSKLQYLVFRTNLTRCFVAERSFKALLTPALTDVSTGWASCLCGTLGFAGPCCTAGVTGRAERLRAFETRAVAFTYKPRSVSVAFTRLWFLGLRCFYKA